jgi:hypothetical protein
MLSQKPNQEVDEFEDYYSKRKKNKDQPPSKPGVVAMLNKIEFRALEDERNVKKEWIKLQLEAE